MLHNATSIWISEKMHQNIRPIFFPIVEKVSAEAYIGCRGKIQEASCWNTSRKNTSHTSNISLVVMDSHKEPDPRDFTSPATVYIAPQHFILSVMHIFHKQSRRFAV
jgi:hypothetical protein